LVIGFRRFRDIPMKNQANIGLIDAHAKGRGADHDGKFMAHP